MNIALDMMGGDFAPLEAIKGIKLYHSNSPGNVTLYCIGNQEEIQALLLQNNVDTNSIQIVHASEVIGYNEHPTKALKEKQQSSIAIGFHLLASGKVDAFISAGNTGAMLVGAMFTIKAVDGILRPTIATIIPKLDGSTGLLLDVGLNVDCKPEYLNQFAMLGSLYAKNILGIENPRISLLNVGEEEGKGNLLSQATYPLLKENSNINFIGNTEGRDIFQNKTDVIVCDGFTGNVILKMAESIFDIAQNRGVQNDTYFHRFHYENYGGTPVLGVAKPVIIGHGISNDVAFKNMIVVAEKMISSNLCKQISNRFIAL